MKRKKPEPIYLGVYKKLRGEILDGVYKDGEKLPSKRLLAESEGISVITAEHVFALLESEGYIEARERSGYYCIFKTSDRFLSSVSAAEEFPESDDTVKAEGFPFGLYAKTARQVLSRYGEELFSRSGVSGSAVLKREIAAYLGRSRGMAVSPEQIIIGSSAEILYLFIIDMLGSGRVYAAEKPSYEMIEKVYKSRQVKYEMLPLGSNGIKSGALAKTAASVLHITPYRSFPSGVSATASKRAEYIRWASAGDRYIVEDDVESEFTVTGKIYDTVFSASKADNVIYMNTFSKTVSPAIRTAYLVLPKSLLKKAGGDKDVFSCTVPTFEQYIIATMLKNGEFERHINRTRRKIRKEMQNAFKKA